MADVPGLYVVGDWVGDEGLLVDASLASARKAADLICAAADDRFRDSNLMAQYRSYRTYKIYF